jgi:hypothetical protein
MKCNVPFREGVGVDKNYLMVASTQLSLSLSGTLLHSPPPLIPYAQISLQSERFRNLTERGILLTFTGTTRTMKMHWHEPWQPSRAVPVVLRM